MYRESHLVAIFSQLREQFLTPLLKETFSLKMERMQPFDETSRLPDCTCLESFWTLCHVNISIYWQSSCIVPFHFGPFIKGRWEQRMYLPGTELQPEPSRVQVSPSVSNIAAFEFRLILLIMIMWAMMKA